jgi:transcription antitermination factor NusG
VSLKRINEGLSRNLRNEAGLLIEQPPIETRRAVHSAELPSEYVESRWYAACTSPRHEKKVALQMDGNQIQHFLPLYASLRRWKDRRKQLDLPLFPGYIFVRVALKDRLQVLQVPGVLQLISFGGKPAPLPDAEIEALSKGLAGGCQVQPHPYLKVGRRVRVHSGPMSGVEGILIRRKEKFRVVLSIHLIQRSVAVEVDENEIEPLN